MIRSIVNGVVGRSDCLYDIAVFFYNMVFSKCRLAIIFGKIKVRGVRLKGSQVSICGENCKISIERKSKLNRCKIVILGDNCSITGGTMRVSNCVFWLEDKGSRIEIGNHFTMESGHIASTEGDLIQIGDDCMFSNDVEVRNGDSHPVLDMGTGNRINSAKTVVIGNHVWLTAHVRILKGSYVPSNCIIGNSAIITGILAKPNSIYAGNPIHVIKENIKWERDRKKYLNN